MICAFYIVNSGDLCISGANDTSYGGKYEYFATSTNPNGLIWYNSINKKYLYPWLLESGNVSWSVGPSYYGQNVDLNCIASGHVYIHFYSL